MNRNESPIAPGRQIGRHEPVFRGAIFFIVFSGWTAAAGLQKPAVSDAYRTVPAFGNLSFDQPVELGFAPADAERVFVAERGGRIYAVRDRLKPTREIFLDLSSRLSPSRNEGLLTFAFHPGFAENGFVFVWYSLHERGERVDRLSRFKVSGSNREVLDRASETPFLSQITGPGGHDGGQLLFGPDGYLYLSLGDGDENRSEPAMTRQRIDRSFFGAIIRIDVDRKPGGLLPNPHPFVHAGTYTVPPDNPFVGATSFNGEGVLPTRVRTEFWAVGMRNPWRMAFDSETGHLWCGDIGLHLREEIDIIVPGGNYGWNFREGSIAGTRERPPPEAKFLEPVWEYERTQGISITGGLVYRGKKFSELAGSYLFGDYGFGRIWALKPDGDKPVGTERVTQIAMAPGVVSIARHPRDDEILFASYTTGEVTRLVRRSENGK
ncbi:MAG: PQQ-dependent sugar dehydrogenase [Opitutaceae bacterium]